MAVGGGLISDEVVALAAGWDEATYHLKLRYYFPKFLVRKMKIFALQRLLS